MTLTAQTKVDKGTKSGVFLILTQQKNLKQTLLSKRQHLPLPRSYSGRTQRKMAEDKMLRYEPKRMNLKSRRILTLQEESGYIASSSSSSNNHEWSSELCDRLSPLPSDIRSSPRRVKVVLHEASTSPYLVVFKSDNKYASPMTYIKLKHFSVSKEHDCKLKLTRVQSTEDLGSNTVSSSIVFEAFSELMRDEWLNVLLPLCCKKHTDKQTKWHIAPNKRSCVINSLPSLQEEDEETENVHRFHSTSLKSPVRKISRMTRKTSFGQVKSVAIVK